MKSKTVKLSQFLRHPTVLLRRMAGNGIDIDIITPGDLWDVSVDREQLESALLSLFLNACDAMQSGGRLTIVARNQRFDGADNEALRGLENGEHVRLDITDTGAVAPPGVTEKVLNSFSTIRESGRAFTPGLSAVHEIVTQSGGRMTIDSEAGPGTTVSLILPRAFVGTERSPPAELPLQQRHDRCS